MVKWPFRKVKWPPTIGDGALVPGELGLRILRYHCSALVEMDSGSAFFSVNLIGGLRDPALFVAVPGWWNTVRIHRHWYQSLKPFFEKMWWLFWEAKTQLRKLTLGSSWCNIYPSIHLSIQISWSSMLHSHATHALLAHLRIHNIKNDWSEISCNYTWNLSKMWSQEIASGIEFQHSFRIYIYTR